MSDDHAPRRPDDPRRRDAGSDRPAPGPPPVHRDPSPASDPRPAPPSARPGDVPGPPPADPTRSYPPPAAPPPGGPVAPSGSVPSTPAPSDPFSFGVGGGTPPPTDPTVPVWPVAGAPDPVADPAEPSGGGSGRGALIAVIAVVALAVGALGVWIASVLGGEEAAPPTSVPVATLPTTETTTTEATPDPDDDPPAEEPPAPATVSELARSTVQVILLDGDVPTCTGSGTFVDPDGTILTNAHVVERDPNCRYDRIGIAVTDDSGRPPDLLYVAEIYAFDPVTDLAVLRIVGDLDGGAADGPFRAVPVGDSDEVEIGDQLRILGYPGIGGDTITFTRGVVSGFASQNGVGERSWIKTDATIAGGNSGGAAFDADGFLIGVPTQAASSQESDVVDCRVITDTNGDGRLTEDDQCVPIGGFLNGIRPVNLAIPLIEEAAAAADSLDPAETTPEITGPFDPAQVAVYHGRWTTDASEDPAFDPTIVRTATAGIERLCIYFDWEGIPQNVSWDGVWRVEGVNEDDFSFFGETWNVPSNGSDFWLCAQDESGLVAGLYEFIFYIEEDPIFYESFEITAEPRALHPVTFVNASGTDLCYLYVAPGGSLDTGLDELGATEIVEPGGDKTVEVAEGTVIADAYDCNFDPLYSNYDGIAVSGPLTIEVAG